MKIPIVFACNDSYVMPLCVAVTSMIYNKKPETVYDIWILHSGLCEKSKEKLQELESRECHVQMLDVDALTEKIQKSYEKRVSCKAVSKETMYRILMPQLFLNLDKVLYLDCDVIVQGDLEQLYSYDLQEAYAGVVTDTDVELRIRVLGKKKECYFNAGMLLMNLKKMRKDSITEKLLKEFFGGPDYEMMDQDILNIVLGENVVYFSEKYNFLSGVIVNGGIERILANYNRMKLNSIAEYLDEIVILHYAGAKKPWLYELPYVTDLFMKYFKLSNYKDYNLTLMPEEMDSPMDRYLIPDWDIPVGSKVILYGAGNLGKAYFQYIMTSHKYKLVEWVDSNAESYQLQGLPVELPLKLSGSEFDYIIIGVRTEKTADDIRQMLEQMGIKEEKMKWMASCGIPSFLQLMLEYRSNMQ